MAREAGPADCRDYFGRGYVEFYRGWLIPEEQTRAEAAWLVRRLRPRRGARWLDIPCGYGRHLAELAALRPDLRLHGGDWNLDYLREAREGAPSAAVARCDVRAIPFASGSFDAALVMLNSFGYFGGAGDRRFLAELARVLRPGGRVALDLPNRRALLAIVRATPRLRYATEGYDGEESFRWNAATQVMHNTTRWRWPGGEQRRRYALRLYTPAEVRRLLARAGLEWEVEYGDFRGGAFHAHHSDRLLVIARKL